MFIYLLAFPFFERKKFPSVSGIEAAEDLVVFQTKNLDTNDQAFHGAYKEIPRTTTIQFGEPPSVAPASISTTSIIAAWLTAKAPIRRKERVLER